VLAREQIFENHPAPQKAREIATVITNEVGRKWGVINEIIELSQNEPLSKSSMLLRASLRVCAYLVYFERKNPYHLVNLIRNFILGKTREGLLKRLFFVLRKIEKFKGGSVKSFEDYAFWYQFFPRWAARKMVEEFGQEEALRLMEEMNKLPFMTVRANTKRITPEKLLFTFKEKYRFDGELVDYPFVKLAKVYPVMRTDEYEEGLFSIQDKNTAVGVLELVKLLPESSCVLDACAAPGRKSSLIAQERPDVELFCVDISRSRLDKLVREFERLKFERPLLVAADASLLPFKGGFDAVVADLPCSGSGTWGKHPERKWFTSSERYKECVLVQKKILGELSGFVKPSGYLLYSTCSIWREENEEMVDWFLGRYLGFKLLKMERIPPENASTGFFYAILQKL